MKHSTKETLVNTSAILLAAARIGLVVVVVILLTTNSPVRWDLAAYVIVGTLLIASGAWLVVNWQDKEIQRLKQRPQETPRNSKE